MFGDLSQKQIEDVLHHQVIGRVGCHAENMVYVVPISYAYDGQYIYGHTHEGMKINMMRKNKNICFEVDVLQDMANWQSVIAWGEFEELTDKTERNKALQKLIDRVLPLIPSETTKLYPDWPFKPKDLNVIKGVVYRILLTKKTGRFENNQTPSFLSWG